MKPLPSSTSCIIIGSGFAGAATAWALARAGSGPGVILEQEASFGMHASGRNAALFRVAEEDPLILALASRSREHVLALEQTDGPLLGAIGGLTLSPHLHAAEERHDLLARAGVDSVLLTRARAHAQFPWLHTARFETALWCPAEAVVDIHGLLGRYLQRAREGGFILHTSCRVEDLLVECGQVRGVITPAGEVRADVVVDASGAWAGRLGRAARPLPLQPLRRHLFVSGPPGLEFEAWPFVWFEEPTMYFRPEGDGLLLSPCDETPSPPGEPTLDPHAAEALAEKIEICMPALSDLPLRRHWACLRTFAPDRRPLIGADPALGGLFHVSGLGGFGVTTSAAVGELAATLLRGETPDWIDVSATEPVRFTATA
ncbi:MAG: FAD-binding oxidoreductase [Acidobacteria bacterium]|nr:FAD-binding oxidoreductase [Acidobacteriota bacterium]